MFLAAVVQMTSTSDPEANWRQARGLIERAASYGARLVATPENTNFLGPAPEKVRTAEPIDGPTCRRFGELAGNLGITVLLGSFNERGDDPGPDEHAWVEAGTICRIRHQAADARCSRPNVKRGIVANCAIARIAAITSPDTPGGRWFQIN